MTIALANAPVSYGAFELTVGIMPGVPDGDTVLDEVASAGYAGIDLGPLGYLGTGDQLRRNLERRSLGLAGGFFELPFSEPAEMDAAIAGLGGLLDAFDAISSRDGLRPRPTLAALGSRSQPFDDARWRRFADGVERALEVCRKRGYEPTFHHETGTQIETPEEIERVLDLTSTGLCLDTGHLLLGGGDPVRAIDEWRPRINHLHLKDARRSVVEQIVRESAPVSEIWKRKAFCRLGAGDLDVDAMLNAIRDSYDGWIVVEQDVLPEPDGSAAEDQRANRRYLAERGF
ncbi:MAG TPA: sugar phosphate isomerase/epimerase [Candidatus Dormibacteraeota bacterium]|nr:sugar phosphate isomerase/epimerase [Candidatus Dormibacteraeota bacterium]